jgi:hypothetical protein
LDLLQPRQQRIASADQPRIKRAYGTADDLRRFLVRITFNHHEQNRFALLVWQMLQGAVDLPQLNCLLLPATAANGQACLFGDECLAPSRPSALFIDPDIPHDPVHPTVEARAWLPLTFSIERANDSHLAQIVAFGRVARQACRKSPQPWQQRHDAFLEVLDWDVRLFLRIKRMSLRVSSLLK